jgi:hypothetical protein
MRASIYTEYKRDKKPWIPYLKLEASDKSEELAFRVFCLFLLFSGHLLLHIFILILSFIFVNMSFKNNVQDCPAFVMS